MNESREPRQRRRLVRGAWGDRRRVDVPRAETVGGALALVAAGAALGWANSPWSPGYHAIAQMAVGPASAHLRLTLAQWAADGLLAVFFFVVGLELKREFVAGELRAPGRAVLPIAAALGGMVVPAAIFIAVNANAGAAGAGGSTGPDAGRLPNLDGWAVPIATDIAFALAILSVLATHLPTALRTFLLTLAVVDDLVAIAVIAVVYTDRLAPGPLVGALVSAALFAVAVQTGRRRWWLLVPLALLTWLLVHAGGVHATVAGVLLGFTVPAVGQHASVQRFERRLRPVSALVAVPVFAFFAAGVTVGGWAGLGASLRHPVTIGVAAGLVIGKPVGVLATTFLLTRSTRASLDEDLRWRDLLGVALLAGVGFTVALLIGELAFGYGTEAGADAKIGVLAGSLVAGVLAALVLAGRNAAYRRIHRQETAAARGGLSGA